MGEEWIELSPGAKAHRSAEPDPVRVGMTVMRPGARGRLSLIIKTDLLKALGGRSFRYRVMRGTGAYKHLLRIVQDDAGVFEAGDHPNTNGAFKRILCPPFDGDPDQKRPSAAARFETKPLRRELIVSLPAWVWNR